MSDASAYSLIFGVQINAILKCLLHSLQPFCIYWHRVVSRLQAREQLLTAFFDGLQKTVVRYYRAKSDI